MPAKKLFMVFLVSQDKPMGLKPSTRVYPSSEAAYKAYCCFGRDQFFVHEFNVRHSAVPEHQLRELPPRYRIPKSQRPPL